jgi:hypothetical protein
MAISAAMAQDLGALIDALNPYTDLSLPNGNQTGDMNIYTAIAAAQPPVPPGTHRDQIELEVDTKYPGEWTFKGQVHRLGKSVRIRYRFPVMDGSGNLLYWVEDHLLIGFEGSDGGG